MKFLRERIINSAYLPLLFVIQLAGSARHTFVFSTERTGGIFIL